MAIGPKDRALSDLFLNARNQVDWHNMRSMVTKCAEGAHALGYKYFGIQFFGECWGSITANLEFDTHGKGTKCYEGLANQLALRFITFRSIFIFLS